MLNGNDLALGRNHHTADSASLTAFGDHHRADLRWLDGAHIWNHFDDKAEAVAYLARMGFGPKAPEPAPVEVFVPEFGAWVLA